MASSWSIFAHIDVENDLRILLWRVAAWWAIVWLLGRWIAAASVILGTVAPLARVSHAGEDDALRIWLRC